jgi:peptidyl-prolyl isomerase H (cyclophilin H)
VVFFDIEISGVDSGRIYFELFANITPKTSENFRQFCTGEFKLGPSILGYKNCKFHRVVKNFMLQGGDFLNSNGTGSMSIFKEESGKAKEMFEDENFYVKHSKAGLLSMANSGSNTNGSQFFITCNETPFLDDKHVVFGQVIEKNGGNESMTTIRKMESVGTTNEKPNLLINIKSCG